MGGRNLWDSIEQRTRLPIHWFGQSAPVQISGSDDNALAQDVLSRALITIDYAHHEVHEGSFYETSVVDLALANNGTLIIGATIPAATFCHFTFEAACGGDALVEMLEGPTFVGGSAVAIQNANRNVADAAFTALKNPTLGGAPVIIPPEGFILPGGKGPNAGGAAGGARAGIELITKASTNYAIRLTNLSGATKVASIAVGFYIKTTAAG